MMRRVDCLRTVNSTVSRCHLGPVRLMDFDPEVQTYVPQKRPNDFKYYARGLIQCAHGVMRITAWGVTAKAIAPLDTSMTIHQVLLSNVGNVLEFHGAMICEAHANYREYSRFCVTFDQSKNATVAVVTDPIITQSIPTVLLDQGQIADPHVMQPMHPPQQVHAPVPVAPQFLQPIHDPPQQAHAHVAVAPQVLQPIHVAQHQGAHQQHANTFVPQPNLALAPLLQQLLQQAYMYAPQSTPVLAPQQHHQQQQAYMHAPQSTSVLTPQQQHPHISSGTASSSTISFTPTQSQSPVSQSAPAKRPREDVEEESGEKGKEVSHLSSMSKFLMPKDGDDDDDKFIC